MAFCSADARQDPALVTTHSRKCLPLRRIWAQELRQDVNPSNLPCGFTVLGINLDPEDATNNVGEDHTVTATLTDLLGAPQPDILVDFRVTSGPSVGESGSATTDANGEATFTYTDDGGVGVDEIEACFTDAQGNEQCSQTVTKTWVNVAPTCGLASVTPTLVAVNTKRIRRPQFHVVGR